MIRGGELLIFNIDKVTMKRDLAKVHGWLGIWGDLLVGASGFGGSRRSASLCFARAKLRQQQIWTLYRGCAQLPGIASASGEKQVPRPSFQCAGPPGGPPRESPQHLSYPNWCVMFSTVFDLWNMELAEIGRCRASVSPSQTHQGGLLGSIGMAVAVFWGCPLLLLQHATLFVVLTCRVLVLDLRLRLITLDYG